MRASWVDSGSARCATGGLRMEREGRVMGVVRGLRVAVRRLLVVVASVGLAGTSGVGAQVSLAVTVTPEQRAGIEELARRAWGVSAAVLEAEAALARSTWVYSPEGRLAEALSVTGNAGISGDVYGQAAPRAAISVSLDVMTLAGEPEAGELRALEARVAAARGQVRVAVLEAAVRLLVARAAAESAAQGLETAEAAFRVAEARLELGDVTATAVLEARLAVSQAAVGLLRANAEAVVALESLAAQVGLGAAETGSLLGF